MAGSREISDGYHPNKLPKELDVLFEEEQNEVSSLPLFTERWRSVIPSLAIFGPAGTGKTLIGATLAKGYDMEFFKGGGVVRAKYRMEHGADFTGWDDRPIEQDLRIDQLVREQFDRAKKGTPTIVESRLAGVIATEMMQESGQISARPLILRGLWTADADVAARRVAQRQGETDVDKVMRLNAERERKNLERWRTMHRILEDPDTGRLRNFNDPECKKDGIPIFYDFKVDTTNLSVAESIMHVHNYLEEKGFVEKVTNHPRRNPPITIFPAL